MTKSITKLLKTSLLISLLSISTIAGVYAGPIISSLLPISTISGVYAFEPIGRAKCVTGGFTGTFSGKGGGNGTQYKITGLDASGDYAALFGCASNATITDVVIDDSNITNGNTVSAILGYAGDNVKVINNVVGPNPESVNPDLTLENHPQFPADLPKIAFPILKITFPGHR